MARALDRRDSVSAATDEGEIVKAAAAALRQKRPLRHPRLREAAEAPNSKQPAEAERLLSKYLEKHPGNATALHVLAETAMKLGEKQRALALLTECLERAPDYEGARFSYASTLYQLSRLVASLAQLEQLLAGDPHNVLYLDLKAAVLTAMGQHRDSMLCRRQLAEGHPNSSELW